MNQDNGNGLNNETGVSQQPTNQFFSNGPQVNSVPETNAVNTAQPSVSMETNNVSTGTNQFYGNGPQVNSVSETNAVNTVQPNVSMETNNIPSGTNQFQQQTNNRPKRSNKPLILALIVFFVIIICLGIGGYFLAKNIINSDSKLIQGTWDCGEGAEIFIDSKNFNISVGSDTKINATYKATKTETQGSLKKITIYATAKKRLIDGVEYTDTLSNEYQVALDQNNPDEIAMINTRSYSMLSCTRKK